MRAAPASAQTPTAFSGAAPGPGQIALLVTVRDASAADLAAGLRVSGCEPESLSILSAGLWSVFIVGAPAAVNAAFPEELAADTPFFVRCRATPPSSVSATPAPSPTLTPTPPPTPIEYPSGYYLGPLVETHLHLGRETPSLTSGNVDSFVGTLDRHDIQRAILFAGLGGSAAREVRQVITARYADRLVLFGSIGGRSPAEVSAEGVRAILDEGIYRGIGEVALYQGSWEGVTPSDPVLLEVYPVLAEYGAAIMLHPASSRAWNRRCETIPTLCSSSTAPRQ